MRKNIFNKGFFCNKNTWMGDHYFPRNSLKSEYFIQNSWSQHQMSWKYLAEVKTSESSQRFCQNSKLMIMPMQNPYSKFFFWDNIV